MDWAQKTVESWNHLQEAIDPLAGRCIFRGQENCEWSLIPSFNRLVPCADESEALRLERDAILAFRSEAHLHLNPSVIPPNAFKLNALDTYLEWLMLMQHHGAPTRLLDWTYSPYVAIYFAVIDQEKSDAAIWYFDWQSVNRTFFQHHGKNPDSDYFDFADLPADQIMLTSGNPVLYVAQKKMRTARECAQQGVFTFTNRLAAHHQEVIAQTCQDHGFGRIIVPEELKKEFAWRLRLMNVTAASLFPGVEGICDSIRDQLRLAVAWR